MTYYVLQIYGKILIWTAATQLRPTQGKASTHKTFAHTSWVLQESKPSYSSFSIACYCAMPYLSTQRTQMPWQQHYCYLQQSSRVRHIHMLTNSPHSNQGSSASAAMTLRKYPRPKTAPPRGTQMRRHRHCIERGELPLSSFYFWKTLRKLPLYSFYFWWDPATTNRQQATASRDLGSPT